MQRSKKAQSVLNWTLGLLLFNVIVYILITAFAMDNYYIGRAANVMDDGEEYANLTGTSFTPTSIGETKSFFTRFYIFFFDMPWWIGAIIASVNTLLLIIIIAAWIRGV